MRSRDELAEFGELAGYGQQQFIPASALLSYQINFENASETLVPAQTVQVTDSLTNILDLTTFQLTEIGFGNRTLTVPPRTQHFIHNECVSYLGVNFDVQIEAGIRLATGEAYATFRSIDPATGLPPANSLGFLPPEDGTDRQGWRDLRAANLRQSARLGDHRHVNAARHIPPNLVALGQEFHRSILQTSGDALTSKASILLELGADMKEILTYYDKYSNEQRSNSGAQGSAEAVEHHSRNHLGLAGG